MGKVEESRLGLKPYAQQLEEKARANEKAKGKPKKTRTPLLPETLPGELTRDEARTAYCNADVDKRRKKSASTVDLDDCYENGDEFLTDGHAFIGQHNWKAGIETKVHCDFGVSHSLVTTGALKGTELLKHVQSAEKILSVGGSDDVTR